MRRIVSWLPNAVTWLGLGLGLWGAVLGLDRGWPFLIASLALDVVDGRLAAYLNVATSYGANLDWHTDVALAHVLAWRCFAPTLAALASAKLVLLQGEARRMGARVSGRAAVTVIVVGLTAWRHLHS